MWKTKIILPTGLQISIMLDKMYNLIVIYSYITRVPYGRVTNMGLTDRLLL